jgi:hypothetical protein
MNHQHSGVVLISSFTPENMGPFPTTVKCPLIRIRSCGSAALPSMRNRPTSPTSVKRACTTTGIEPPTGWTVDQALIPEAPSTAACRPAMCLVKDDAVICCYVLLSDRRNICEPFPPKTIMSPSDPMARCRWWPCTWKTTSLLEC